MEQHYYCCEDDQKWTKEDHCCEAGITCIDGVEIGISDINNDNNNTVRQKTSHLSTKWV